MSDQLIATMGESATLTDGPVDGIVKEIETYSHEEYGDSIALVLQTESDVELRAFYNFPDVVTPSHDLGGLIQRFGGSTEPGANNNLEALFGAGTEVTFQVKEEEEEDGGLDVVNSSVVPKGNDTDESQAQSLDSAASIDSELADVLDGMDVVGTSEKALYGELATEGGETVSLFKKAVDNGLIQVDSGTVVDVQW